jgi:hypothetical protein
VISRLAFSIVLLLLLAPPSLAIPGGPACPDDSKKEVYILPTARVDNSPCACQTLVSCMNLDRKNNRITVQFFASASSASQQGFDAALTLDPGDTRVFGTNSDPLGILAVSSSAGFASSAFSLSGRVCAATPKLACDAFVSCDCGAGGAIFSPLRIILKKQKGD